MFPGMPEMPAPSNTEDEDKEKDPRIEELVREMERSTDYTRPFTDDE